MSVNMFIEKWFVNCNFNAKFRIIYITGKNLRNSFTDLFVSGIDIDFIGHLYGKFSDFQPFCKILAADFVHKVFRRVVFHKSVQTDTLFGYFIKFALAGNQNQTLVLTVGFAGKFAGGTRLGKSKL